MTRAARIALILSALASASGGCHPREPSSGGEGTHVADSSGVWEAVSPREDPPASRATDAAGSGEAVPPDSPPHEPLPDGVVASQGTVRLTPRDVLALMQWNAFLDLASASATFGEDWTSNRGLLANFAHNALQSAFLRAEADRIGLVVDEQAIDDELRSSPRLSSILDASPLDRESALAAWAPLEWNDVRSYAMERLLYDQWLELVVSRASEEDRWSLYAHLNERVTVEWVRIPNRLTDGELPRFIVRHSDEIRRIYRENPDRWMQAGRLRPLADDADIEIARELAASAGAPGALGLASEIASAWRQGSEESLQALLTGHSLSLESPPPFIRSDFGMVPSLGEQPQLLVRLFTELTEPGQILDPPQVLGDELLVARVVAHHLPTRDEFVRDREAFEREYLSMVRDTAWPARYAEWSAQVPPSLDLDRLVEAAQELPTSTDPRPLRADGSGTSP